MHMLLFLTTACSLVLARPQNAPDTSTITKFDFNNVGPGYSYSWETSDGSKREEAGEIKNAGQDSEILVVRGSYSYLGPDGIVYSVKYIADENGFQPEGPHIPNNNGENEVQEGLSPISVEFISSHALASLSGAGLG